MLKCLIDVNSHSPQEPQYTLHRLPNLLQYFVNFVTFAEIQQMLEYIKTLDYHTVPDYNKLRQLFQSGLKKRKATDDGKNVIFTSSTSAATTNGTHDQRDASSKKVNLGFTAQYCCGLLVI